MDITQLYLGESIYVICRNPHTQTVAQIQEASIVENPDQPGSLSLFLFEEYFSLTDEFAMFSSYQEAEEMYNMYFNERDSDFNYFTN